MSDRIFAFPCTAPSPPETKTPPVQRPTASSFPNKFPAFCRAHPALLRRPPWCSGPVGAEVNLRLSMPIKLCDYCTKTVLANQAQNQPKTSKCHPGFHYWPLAADTFSFHHEMRGNAYFQPRSPCDATPAECRSASYAAMRLCGIAIRHVRQGRAWFAYLRTRFSA